MGYGGKVAAQQRARELRAQGWTYNEIVAELGVSKSSVSLWCRDVAVDEAARAARPRPDRNHGPRRRGPNRLQQAKEAEIRRLREEALGWVGTLDDRDLSSLASRSTPARAARPMAAVCGSRTATRG